MTIKPPIKCLLFDCFGTVFDMSPIPKEQIKAYVEHVRKEDFTPYEFPQEWWHLKAHPDAAEGISQLKKDLRFCFAFSNGSWDLIYEVSRLNGILWNGITSPAAMQAYKPNQKAYRQAFGWVREVAAVKPEECLMVTANPAFGDVEGAASVGMQAVVIRHGYPNDIIELAQMIDDGCVEMKE